MGRSKSKRRLELGPASLVGLGLGLAGPRVILHIYKGKGKKKKKMFGRMLIDGADRGEPWAML